MDTARPRKRPWDLSMKHLLLESRTLQKATSKFSKSYSPGSEEHQEAERQYRL